MSETEPWRYRCPVCGNCDWSPTVETEHNYRCRTPTCKAKFQTLHDMKTGGLKA